MSVRNIPKPVKIFLGALVFVVICYFLFYLLTPKDLVASKYVPQVPGKKCDTGDAPIAGLCYVGNYSNTGEAPSTTCPSGQRSDGTSCWDDRTCKGDWDYLWGCGATCKYGKAKGKCINDCNRSWNATKNCSGCGCIKGSATKTCPSNKPNLVAGLCYADCKPTYTIGNKVGDYGWCVNNSNDDLWVSPTYTCNPGWKEWGGLCYKNSDVKILGEFGAVTSGEYDVIRSATDSMVKSVVPYLPPEIIDGYNLINTWSSYNFADWLLDMAEKNLGKFGNCIRSVRNFFNTIPEAYLIIMNRIQNLMSIGPSLITDPNLAEVCKNFINDIITIKNECGLIINTTTQTISTCTGVRSFAISYGGGASYYIGGSFSLGFSIDIDFDVTRMDDLNYLNQSCKFFIVPCVLLGLQAGASNGLSITLGGTRTADLTGHGIGIGYTGTASFGISVEVGWGVVNPNQGFNAWKEDVISSLKEPSVAFGVEAGQEFSAAIVYGYTYALN